MTDQATTAATKTTEGTAASADAGTTTTTAAAQAAGEAVAAASASTQQQDGKGVDTTGTVSGKDGQPPGDTGKPVVPDKYDFKLPEGVQMGDKDLGAYSAVARELNLTQDAAQMLLDKMGPVIAGRHVETLTEAKAQWLESTKVDKEYGGDKLQENLGVAKKALDTFGTPELRTLLNESGLGNHPEIIRAFYRAGKAISEDGFISGGRNNGASGDPAKTLFPSMA
jgi:hypothetical protein